MRILHYIPTYAPAWSWGGPVVSTAALCEGLVAAGHEVTVFTTNAGLDEATGGTSIERNGVWVHYFRRARGVGIHSPELEAAVRREIGFYDILHVTGVWQRSSPAACVAARRAGVPYVVSPRGALGPYSWRRKTLKKLVYFLLYERRNLARAAAFHVTSAAEAAECARFTRGRPVRQIPNGVLSASWRRDEAAGSVWRELRGLATGVPLLLCVGRLHHKKGLDLLPTALAPLRDFRWQLCFVGNNDDGTLPKLEAAFRLRGLNDRVRFLPACAQPELPAVYSAADLFLLPSRHENFGNVVVEALGCGCPVVASDDVGVMPDAMPSGGAAAVPRRKSAWTACIRDFLTSLWRPTAGPSLAMWTRERFSKTKVAEQMADFYASVLKSHGTCQKTDG